MKYMARSMYNVAEVRLVNYWRDPGKFISTPRGWILHVAESSGSLYHYFNGLTSPNRKFSHLWVGRNGRIEQYGDLSYKSWAQVAGNGAWWSVETEGFATEPLTDAQIAALAAWHVWCGASDTLAYSPRGYGIGTHSMGGAAWGGHECPGEIRAAQRAQIICAAQALRRQEKEIEMNLNDTIKLSNGDTATVGQCIGGTYLSNLKVMNATDEVEPWLRATGGHVETMHTEIATIRKGMENVIEALNELINAIKESRDE